MMRLSVLLISVACSIALIHGACGAVLDAKNLVKNPDFEAVKDGKPENWVLGGFSEGGKGTLAISAEKPHGGKNCAHIKGSGEWGTFVSVKIPVEKGKSYELKGFVRVAKGNALVKFDYFKGDMFLGMTSPEFTESTDWVEQTVTSDLSSYPDATHFSATLVGGGGEYEAWFDDISIVEKK